MAKKRTGRRKTKKTKRKTTKTKRKTTKTKRKTKKAFGGYSVSFKNRVESLEQIFGRADIPPTGGDCPPHLSLRRDAFRDFNHRGGFITRSYWVKR